MSYLKYIIYVPFVLWIGLYTFNFGRWCQKRKNLPGAVAVFMLASASTVVSLYILFFRN